MLSNFSQTVKKYKSEILYTIIVFLLLLLSFAIGFIVAKNQIKEPLEVIENSKI